MNNFVIADTHFYHERVIQYCNRPFSNVGEMNKYILEKWNSVVTEEDTIYHLGDVSFGNFDETHEIIQQLKGNKILILGNHDKRRSNGWWRRSGFNEVHHQLVLDNFFLTHHPTCFGVDGYINVHGHTHNVITNLDKNKYKCVSVELVDYTPVNIETLI